MIRGETYLYGQKWLSDNHEACVESYAATAAESAAFIASWRARFPSATREHMPFPGHRHMGEIG